MSAQRIIAFLCIAITSLPLVAMELDLSSTGETDDGLYYKRETETHFIERVRNRPNKPENTHKTDDRLCLTSTCESMAFFPHTHLVAAICERTNHDGKKLLIKNLHTQREQKSNVPHDFVMPNSAERPTIAFDDIGSRVVVLEKLHIISNDRGVEEWKQLYQIVPVTVAHAHELETEKSLGNVEKTDFIERVRNQHHKLIPNKYYSMLPVEIGSICAAWSSDEKQLALLQNKQLIIIDTGENDKMTTFPCDREKYENIAFSHPLVAMIYRCKHNDNQRKLLIKHLHTQSKQESDVPAYFDMPNLGENLSIAFDEEGKKVIIVGRLHQMKKYKKGATEEYGSREKWGQFYKVVPVTL